MLFITWATVLRPVSTLASSGNQPIQTIRIPKHLNGVSKIKLLKLSLDVSFLYYQHIFSHHQSRFNKMRKECHQAAANILNSVLLSLKKNRYINTLPLLLVLPPVREKGLGHGLTHVIQVLKAYFSRKLYFSGLVSKSAMVNFLHVQILPADVHICKKY